jgi:enoyl-CoA hydratase/carnithine racemase
VSGIEVRRAPDGAATVLIDRPERSNAIDPAAADAIHAALSELAHDPEVRVVLLRGTGGRAFCGGFDLSGVTTGVRDEGLQRMLERLRSMPVPTVAVLDGHAVGAGFDLACSCDLRIVRRGSKVGLPAVRLGVAYHAAGLRRIRELVPLSRRMLLTGELVLGEDLPGFADVVTEPDELDPVLAELVTQLAAAAPASLEYMVTMLRPQEPDLVLARVWRNRILDGPDPAAAAAARVDGSAPVFAPRVIEG